MKAMPYIQHVNRYLSRHSGYDQLSISNKNPDVNLIVVIPSYFEKELEVTLRSLSACIDSDQGVEIIVILNSSENCSEEIRTFHRNQQVILEQLKFPFKAHIFLLENIPSKIAGVGYARKTGMDTALKRLATNHAEDGIIVCLDADCHVSPNYFTTIQEYFKGQLAKQAVHLYFEHVMPRDADLKKSIIHYELHLRLMKLNLQKAGHPQAYHTVGSCLAVKAWAYAAQGGMNSRQAGEDFYFIHKFSKIGQLDELNTTTVYPSARESSRVPFGTGAAVKKAMGGLDQRTYHPDSYRQIQKIITEIPIFYSGDYTGQHYFLGFKSKEFTKKIDEIRKHTSNLKAFTQRFFQWFDAFQVIKFLHYLRDCGNCDQDAGTACRAFLQDHGCDIPMEAYDQLEILRQIDKKDLSPISA
jgi:hypothetical protein